MRKPRKTVYVSPGKDVTLYVPADTPHVVIDYLNHLKSEGQFSQGVMDILIRHVTSTPDNEYKPPIAVSPPSLSDEVAPNPAVQSPQAPSSDNPSLQSKMADIFRQAQKNSSRLADTRSDSQTE